MAGAPGQKYIRRGSVRVAAKCNLKACGSGAAACVERGRRRAPLQPAGCRRVLTPMTSEEEACTLQFRCASFGKWEGMT
jgi:hypothetical protein